MGVKNGICGCEVVWPKVTEMGFIIGHTIDHNGQGDSKSQRHKPGKNDSGSPHVG